MPMCKLRYGRQVSDDYVSGSSITYNTSHFFLTIEFYLCTVGEKIEM